MSELKGAEVRATVQDEFWGRYIRLVQDTVIPYQYEVLHDRVAGLSRVMLLPILKSLPEEKRGRSEVWSSRTAM